MSRPEVIYTFAQYEIRRAIARKKVLALVAFTILLGVVPYYALSTAGTTLISSVADPYIWIAGVFIAGPLFLNFTAILIAAGAMSEEYEQGTAELLLSKPVRRIDYFAGKFLGGYILFLAILAFDIFLSVASAFTFFGAQNSLGLIPGLFLAQAFSSLVFYSLAFMLGELIRRSSLAYIFSSTVFFSSFIISEFLALIYNLTNKSIYKTVQIYLPTSPASSLPIQYAFPRLPTFISSLRFLNATAVVPTIGLSIEILLAYTLVAVGIAVAYFLRADISRKLS
ncbi:MAG: ABC transporter permease [Candidatus Bathyarchaeia archaeon]